MIGNKELPEYKNKYEDMVRPLATPRKRGRPKKSEVGIAKPTDKKRGRPSKAEKENNLQSTKSSTSFVAKILGQSKTKNEMDYMFENREIEQEVIENIEKANNFDIAGIHQKNEKETSAIKDIENDEIEEYYYEQRPRNPRAINEKIGYLTIIIALCMMILVISQALIH